MSGHLDVLAEQLLAYSTGNPFMLLSRATRDAVPRRTIDASLPGKLDAALARNDETAARRLAGEAMRRVARNFRTLNGRLAARGYPVRYFHPRSGRAYARAINDYDSLVADVPHHVPLMLEEFWRWVGGCTLCHGGRNKWFRREYPGVLEFNKRLFWVDGYGSMGDLGDDPDAYRWDEHESAHTDPLHIGHLADLHYMDIFETNERGNPVYSGSSPYAIELTADAGLDPLIADELMPHGYMNPEFAEALERNEDPLRPDIEEVLTRTWLSENPGLTSEDIAVKFRKFNYTKDKWLMTMPGPGDRGPLTLLEYLRLALLVHGGFTGLNAANPNFDPLRRALIADLEPF